MSDLADILVKFRNVEEGLQALGRRDDVTSEALQKQIEELDRRLVAILGELESHLHSDLMRAHDRPMSKGFVTAARSSQDTRVL